MAEIIMVAIVIALVELGRKAVFKRRVRARLARRIALLTRE